MENNFKFRSILLIDDNDTDNYVNKRIIEKSRFAEQVYTLKSAKDAINFLKNLEEFPEHLPEIIFLDIKMPEIDGFGFLKLYANLSDTIKNKCSIIMLTSSVDPIDYNRALSNPHVFNYLKKPLNIEELLAIAA